MNFAARYREEAPVNVALAGLFLLTLAVVLTLKFQQSGPGIGGALPWLLMLLALLALGTAVVLLRDGRPAVRLGLDGIRDRRWSAKPIPWANIAEFDVVRWCGMPAVQLRLEKPALNPPARFLPQFLRANNLVEPDAVLLLVPGLDCTAEELCERIMTIGTAALTAAEEAQAWASAGAYAAPPQG